MIDFDDSKGMPKEDIIEIEKFTNFKLTDEIKELFKNQSGGRYKDDKTYLIGWETDFDIELDTWIVNVETKETILSNWKNRSYLKEYMDTFEVPKSYVETDKLFPIFELVDGAIYIAIGGIHNKKIFYAANEYGIVNIASSLKELCDKMVLFE